MKKLFFVRHGQTHHNVQEILSGQIETELTDMGKEQARLSGQRIKQDLPKIDIIIASPIGRAHHTAKIIAEQIGYPVEKIILSPLFMERSFGILEGDSAAEFKKNHDYRELDEVEKAESIEQMHERAEKAFVFVKAVPEDNVMVVSHGSFGRAFRRVVEARPHTDEYDTQETRIGNAEIIELI
jgi:probable phosphoglycerate mutase